jgi:TP901 family phage tail tape measure protein
MASTDLLLRIRADVADAQRSVDAVRKSLRELDGAAKVKLDLSLDNLRAQVGKGIADLRAKFQEGFRDVSSGLLGDIAKNVGTIINPVGAATAAIAGLGAAIKSGFEAYQRFNDALTNLSVITGVTGDALDALGATAREMALTFGGDASNQLDLMSQVLSKFGPALAQNKEALTGFVERVNVFAKATGQDAATAGDQLMNVMLQLGVNVNDSAELLSESSHIMDVLAKAAQEGAAETSQLAESYLQVGSTAKQLGFSVEQVSAALEAMAFGGKTGAEAGVGLRNVLTSLVRPTSESARVLAQLGLSQQEVAEKMRTGGIAGVVEQLSIGLQRLGGDTERAAALARIFGKENLAAAGALINNLDKLKDLQSKIQSGSQGAALAQAQTRMQSLSEILGRLKTAATEVLSALGEAVARIASSFGVVFGDASGSVASFVESLRSGINTVADVLIALTAPMRAAWAAIFGYVSGFISSIVDAFKDVAAQVSGALGSLGTVNVNEVLSSFVAALRTVAEWIGRVAGAIAGLSFRAIGYFITAIVTVVRHTVEWIRNNAALQAVLQVVSFWVQQAVANIMQMVNWIGQLLGIIGKSTEAKKQEADATQAQAQAQVQAAESARQASTNYAALAAQLERVVAASQRYVSAVQQYVQLATKAEALGRGLAQPTTEQQLRANAIQLQSVLDQLRKLSAAAGTKNIIEEMLATPLELSADAAERWVEMLARANPIVVKASKDIEDAGDNTDAAAKAQEKYRDALAKARAEAEKLVTQVLQLRVQGQELELKLRAEKLKEQLDDAVKDAERVEITIDLALDETRSSAALQRVRDAIASLRTQLATVPPESDAARAIESTLDKLIALEAKTQEQIAAKRREGLEMRKQLEIDAIADDDARQRAASLARIDREEQEALERARIVQASEETILALKQRYAAERERILNRLTDAERAQQEATKASSDAAFGAIVDSLAVLGDKSKDAMDNFKRTVLTAFLDIAQAQLSVAIFGATAQEVATKGFVGLGTAAILAAILQGLFAAAKAAVQRGFKVGGWTGEGSPDDVAGIVHKREYVVPAPYAERYRPILELMRRGAYEPALAVAPQQQRVRVVVDGQIDVRARDDWMDVARSITLRRRYAV